MFAITLFRNLPRFILPLLVLTSITAYNSCSVADFLDFSQPGIVSFYPENLQVFGTNEIREIKITFSKKMSEQTVEASFSLKRIIVENFDEQTIPGYYSWNHDNNRSSLIFSPQDDLSFGRYRISLLKNAEDTAGNDMKNDTNILFFIGNDFTPPEVAYYYPAYNATNLPETNLIITVGFSEPINTAKLTAMFSVSPNLNYQINVLSNNTVFQLLPVTKYNAGQYYLTFNNDNIEDLFGNKMRPLGAMFFTIGNDFTPPAFTGIYTDAVQTPPPLLLTNGLNRIDKYSSLYFVFSEAVSADLNYIPITFSPSVNGVWQTNSNMIIFSPSQPWDLALNYTASVNDGIQDISGNISHNTYKSYFKIESPSSFFVDATNIVCGPSNWTDPQINDLSNTNVIQVSLVFNNSILPATALENITVSYVSGIGTHYVYISQMEFLNSVTPNDTVRLTIMSNDINLYRLTVKGGKDGLADIYNNWISNDINIYYRMR